MSDLDGTEMETPIAGGLSMRRLIIGVAIVVSLGGAGLAVAQDHSHGTPEVGGTPEECATPQASPDLLASPDDALESTPEILTGTPEASPVGLVDC
jgi:hypothetical protein